LAPPAQPGLRVGTFVLAAALPALLDHVMHRPSVSVGTASVDLADVLVVATGAAAAAAGLRTGFRPLWAASGLWLGAGFFLAWIFVATLIPALGDRPYAWHDHVITAGKFAEYALLAPAVPLLVRRVADLRVPAAVFLAWSAAASAYGVVEILTGIGLGPAGRRKPSFIGFHDFGSLSGAVLAVGFVALALGHRRRLLTVGATAVGAVGMIVSGTISAVLGLLAAAGGILLVARRRGMLERRDAVAIVVVSVVVAAGTASLRGPQVGAVLRFLGLEKKEQTSGIESYAHRGVLAYIGVRIFLDHPVLGAGWQASTSERSTYGPYVPDARRRYPAQPAEAFPSPEHPWGVQNTYLQALADLGLVGFAGLAATLGGALWLGIRAALRGPPDWAAVALTGLSWTLVSMGVLIGVGLVAGTALFGVLWLGLGLVAVARAHG
jgi:hypothetical protein